MAPNPEPVDDFSRAVRPVAEWAAAVSGLPVVHDWGEARSGQGAVLLRPLAIAVAPHTGPARSQVTSAELTLDLLVTVVELPVFEAAAATSALALASGDGDWHMAAAGPDVRLWEALGRAPAPAFVLRVPVRRILERPAAPVVQEPIRLVPAHLRTVAGRVVSSDGRPVPAARIGLADGNSPAVHSDSRGRFRLRVATVTGAPLALTILARDTAVTLAVEPVSESGDLGDLTVPVPNPA